MRIDQKYNSKKLMVIISDRLTNIINKGEITERYYNPGNYFEEVHIVLLNDDNPDINILKPTVGDARLKIYNLKKPNIFLSLFYNTFFIKSYVSKAFVLVKHVNPLIIRTHNNFLEGYLAHRIKLKFKIPYIISLHGVWDKGCLYTIFHKIRRFFLIKFESISIKNSDAVIAVYKPIIRYANKYGSKNTKLIYNIVNYNNKFKYSISKKKLRLITINRQQIDKNPENIIRAIKDIGCEYYLIGDGPYHNKLKKIAYDLNLLNKVFFIKSMKNEELINFITTFDIFISNTNVYGTSKGLIEASLCGIPIITNNFPEGTNMDLSEKDFILCQNTPHAFKDAILLLKNNTNIRIKYSNSVQNYALNNFDPVKMENKTINLYKQIIKNYD